MKKNRLLLLSLLLAVAGSLSAQTQAFLPFGLRDIMCNIVVNAGFNPEEDIAVIDFQTNSYYSYGTKISTSGDYSVYAAYNYPKQTLTFYTEADEFVAPKNSEALFYGFATLTNIAHLNKVNTSNVTNMCGIFCGCSSLTSLDLSNFDTSNVVNMSGMFSSCNSLSSIDVSSFDTSNVTEMDSMFANCSSLTTLDLSKFDTSNVTGNLGGMFYGCSSLVSLNVTKFDTSNVTGMRGLFEDCSSLTSLDVSNFVTSNVADMSEMFSNCRSLTLLDISNFDTSKVTSMFCLFNNCSNLTSLDVSNFDTSNVQQMGDMFRNCNSLTSLDVSNFDTSSAMSIGAMFEGCKSLTSIDVSNFVTSNVSHMLLMFKDCNNLTSLDLSNFDTSKVSDMRWMFSGCSSLTSLELSNFDTSNVTDMSEMFSGCRSLTMLDVSNFDTSNVTDMEGMFGSCSSLISLDLSNFGTSNVTNMYDMFSGCRGLNKLILSFIPLSGHRIPSSTTIRVPAVIYDDAVAALPGYNVVKIPAFAPGYYVLTSYRDPVGGALYDNLSNADGDSSPLCRGKLKWRFSSNMVFTYDASLDGTEWVSQCGLPYMIWQAVPAEGHKDGYYLRNWGTGRYIHYATTSNTIIGLVETPTEADVYTVLPVEDDVIEDGNGNYWTFTNENLWKNNGVISALHSAYDYAGVVAWNYDDEGSAWAIRPVTEGELAAIEQYISIEKAFAALENNSEKVFSLDGTVPAVEAEINQWVDFSTVDGLVTRSTQITSNTSDPTEGANMSYLIDGNTHTFWHSNWHKTTVERHSLVIDLGKEVEEVTLKFASRETNLVGNPRVFAIYGSSDGSSWTSIGTSEVTWIDTPCAVSASTNVGSYAGWLTTTLGYRYMKMEIEHTGSIGGTYIDGHAADNLYFSLSELRAYEGQPWKMITINSIADPALKTATEELIAQAREELANGTLTPETLAALNAATDNLKYAVENRVNTLRDDAEYAGTEAKRVNIDYIRNFTSTDWEPLYIPFSMSYDEWANDFEVAAINNIRHDDTNDDGLFDRVSIEARMVKSGKLLPNRPYIIRAKSIGTKTLHAAETLLTPVEQKSIDCSTVDTKFVFTGSYENIAASELTEYGCKVLSGGIVVPANSALNPYRWYITTEEKGSGIKGDMNDDGRISIVDVTILVDVLNGKN